MKEESIKIEIEERDENLEKSDSVDEVENLEKSDSVDEVENLEKSDSVEKNLEFNKNNIEGDNAMENENKTVVNDFNDEKLKNIGVQDEEMDLFFILDRSGSMYGSEEDTINGFNAFIEKQMVENHNILVTTILFNGRYDVLYSRIPISEVMPLTSEEYHVRGSTALLDAIGRTVTHYERVVNSAMCVITTDGYENSSREFNRDQIKDMVQNSGWEFVFIGADIDSYSEASRIGIRSSRVARHRKDSKGFDDMYNAVNNLTTKFYFERDTKDNSDDWKEDLE